MLKGRIRCARRSLVVGLVNFGIPEVEENFLETIPNNRALLSVVSETNEDGREAMEVFNRFNAINIRTL